jgi:hypothetical protein
VSSTSARFSIPDQLIRPRVRLACQNPVVDRIRIIEAFESDSTPLIRTDFTNESAWRAILTDISRPVDFEDPDNPDPGDDGYSPIVTAIDDAAFDGVSSATLGEAFPATGEASGYALLADSRSMTEMLSGGEITLVYVDLSISDPEDAELFSSFNGRAFRCAMREIASIEANLSIANMNFHEFADNTAADGVFRGFNDGD